MKLVVASFQIKKIESVLICSLMENCKASVHLTVSFVWLFSFFVSDSDIPCIYQADNVSTKKFFPSQLRKSSPQFFTISIFGSIIFEPFSTFLPEHEVRRSETNYRYSKHDVTSDTTDPDATDGNFPKDRRQGAD